jgi:hypothetical protein
LSKAGRSKWCQSSSIYVLIYKEECLKQYSVENSYQFRNSDEFAELIGSNDAFGYSYMQLFYKIKKWKKERTIKLELRHAHTSLKFICNGPAQLFPMHPLIY